MIKKILLISPRNTIPDDSVKRIGEPLGLLYVGAMLKNNGYEVVIFDMTCDGYDNCEVKGGYITYGSSIEELRRKILEIQPDMVGVSCLFTARENNAFTVCGAIREVNGNIPIVLGGLHAGMFPERFINDHYADYVIIGEGEVRILQLLECLNKNMQPDFDGVAYKANGSFKINPMLTRIENLDSIPYPDRDLVDMERYISIGTPYAPFSYKQRVAQILATRGCPQGCVFCSTVTYWGKKVRMRSVDNILGELKVLTEKYKIEEIQFIDDNLTVDKNFAKELFIKMKSFQLKWCTPSGLMFNSLDKEMIKLMAESGAYQLSLAIESGVERVLKEVIHKNVNLGMVKPLVEEAHKYDISIHGLFVLGFPGETKEEILKTLDFPFSVGFDSVSFFVVTPFPGTELFHICKEKKYLAENYCPMDFKTMHIRIPKDSPDYNIEPEELVELIERKTREFNEWAKNKYPERWQRKFERYLENHPQDNKIITGRVT